MNQNHVSGFKAFSKSLTVSLFAATKLFVVAVHGCQSEAQAGVDRYIVFKLVDGVGVVMVATVSCSVLGLRGGRLAEWKCLACTCIQSGTDQRFRNMAQQLFKI